MTGVGVMYINYLIMVGEKKNNVYHISTKQFSSFIKKLLLVLNNSGFIQPNTIFFFTFTVSLLQDTKPLKYFREKTTTLFKAFT